MDGKRLLDMDGNEIAAEDCDLSLGFFQQDFLVLGEPDEMGFVEREEIVRYVPYTQEELDELNRQQEMLDAQREVEEAREQEYRELVQSIDDITLLLADLIGGAE